MHYNILHNLTLFVYSHLCGSSSDSFSKYMFSIQTTKKSETMCLRLYQNFVGIPCFLRPSKCSIHPFWSQHRNNIRRKSMHFNNNENKLVTFQKVIAKRIVIQFHWNGCELFTGPHKSITHYYCVLSEYKDAQGNCSAANQIKSRWFSSSNPETKTLPSPLSPSFTPYPFAIH